MGTSRWIAMAALAGAAWTAGGMAHAAQASVVVQVGTPAPYYVWPAEYGYERHYGTWRDRHERDGRHGRHARRVDRDRDGIPDRRDWDLDNDGRPNGYDRDMDGDGVANWRDRAPTNRWRY